MDSFALPANIAGMTSREWLAFHLDRMGRGSKTRLAEFLRVRPETITRMLQDEPGKESRDISADELFRMAEFFNTLPPLPDEIEKKPAIDIPILSWVSAGDLAREDAADEAIGTLTATGLPPGDYIALIVKGDSMDRISPPESRIIINRKEKRLVSNACYVIADENGEATYKRYRADPMRFEPVSVNTAHEPIFPDREPLIVGRVRRTVLDM